MDCKHSFKNKHQKSNHHDKNDKECSQEKEALAFLINRFFAALKTISYNFNFNLSSHKDFESINNDIKNIIFNSFDKNSSDLLLN